MIAFRNSLIVTCICLTYAFTFNACRLAEDKCAQLDPCLFGICVERNGESECDCFEGYLPPFCQQSLRDEFIALFDIENTCEPGIPWQTEILGVGESATAVVLKGFGHLFCQNSPVDLNAIVGTDGLITIPEQTFNNCPETIVFSGSGILALDGKMTLTYTAVSDGVSETCTETWTKN